MLDNGAFIQAYDPQAILNSKNEIRSQNIEYCENYLEACKDADLLVIATEWDQFKKINLTKIKEVIKKPAIFDLRNLLDSNKVIKEGFSYVPIGYRA